MIKAWQSFYKITLGLVAAIAILPQTVGADVPAAENPILSESFCLEFFDRAITDAKSGTLRLSTQDRSIIKKCKTKFSILPDVNTPLPNITECISLIKIVWEGGTKKLLETDFSEEKNKSLERCSELFISYSIPSISMMPTLKKNDIVIVDKTAYKFKFPQRGDIISFKPTATLKKENYKDTFIKRIIGIPGDRVKVKGGKVYINGKSIVEDYLSEPTSYEHPLTIVPANSYFVLGDNRNNSYDSHYWGFVPRNLIIGKLVWQSSTQQK